MKQTTYFLLILFLLASCASKKKLMVEQRYDEVIDRCVKSLIKDPGNEDAARQLDQAYRLANERDISRAKYLRQEGNPDTWDEMLGLYSSLKIRQEKVRAVLPLHFNGKSVEYTYTDYDAEMIEAKHKAADYYYNNGKKMMEQNTKEGCREAYYQFKRARDYSGGSYSDLDQLILQSHDKGISRALIEIDNQTQIKLPPDFISNVLSFNTNNLNSEWVQYYITDKDQRVIFDYLVLINLQTITISPDQVSEKDQQVKKDVDDGFYYALDARGNVMKDTAGNDIKIKKTKTLTCTFIETLQQKTVNLKGEVEFTSLNPEKRLLKKEAIGAESRFSYSSARAVGDQEALSADQLKMIQNKQVAFPTDFEMIGRCTETMSNAVHDAVYRNRQLIQ